MQMSTWTGYIAVHALILHAKLCKVKDLVNMTYFVTKIKVVIDDHHVLCGELLAAEISITKCSFYLIIFIILNYVIIISCLFTLVL